jgi:WD40 repeat protein
VAAAVSGDVTDSKSRGKDRGSGRDAVEVEEEGEEGEDADDGEPVESPAENVTSVEGVGFCASTLVHWAATCGNDGVLRIWDLDSLTCRHELVHPEALVKLQWHASTPVVVTSCADGTTHAYDARSGEKLRLFTGPSDVINDMALGSDEAGDFVVVGSDDGAAYVFRL